MANQRVLEATMANVKDAVQSMTPAAEREAFSEAFPGVVPSNVRPLDNEGRAMEARLQGGNHSEKHLKYLSKLIGDEKRLKLQGYSPATILNANPYPLKANSTLIGDIVCAPCPVGRPYSVTVIRDVRWTREEGLEGDDRPIPWVPIILAREFEETYYSNGGVVIYQGDGQTQDPSITMQSGTEVGDALLRNYNDAEKRKLTWMREKIREANNEWNSPNRQGARNINDIHRACAAEMHDKTGQPLPEWMDKIPGQMGLGEKCPSCSSIPPSDATTCPTCAFTLQPRRAFELGLIDVENVALTRLPRKELEAMGISELVEETIEERLARYQKAAKDKKTAKTAK